MLIYNDLEIFYPNYKHLKNVITLTKPIGCIFIYNFLLFFNKIEHNSIITF